MIEHKKNFAAIAVPIFLAILVAISGASSGSELKAIEDVSLSKADDLYSDAIAEYENENYRTAAEFFSDAHQIYSKEGETEKALRARNWRIRSERMTYQYPYNRTSAEKAIAKAFPNVSEEVRSDWLLEGVTQQFHSDGEILYFEDIVKNIKFRNLDLIREEMRKRGRTPLYDDVKEVAFQDARNCSGPYCNPVTYEGTGSLSVPRYLMPATGLLRLWIPLPIETDSQVNVTILSVEPTEYVKKAPTFDGDIGIVYLEVPLEDLEDDVNASVKFRFTEYERRFNIDPANVGAYDTESDLYRKYTSSRDNIVITPDIEGKARNVVGNETNPYLQAKMIYRYITETLPYSHVPHLTLETAGIPESLYVHETGFGDCGAQSMYFCALCRSLGIPARAQGGMQLIPGVEGPHFWAEFYLPEYGWVPVDVTVAEAADWSFNASQEDRSRFKDFYFGNLDVYRFIIQRDVDLLLDPVPGDAVIFSAVRQYPGAACNTSDKDVDKIVSENWSFSLTPHPN